MRINSIRNLDISLAQFDDGDHSWLSNKKLRYEGRYIKTGDLYVHRLIAQQMISRALTSKDVVDHINGDRLDNRRSNLRVVDKSTNAMNCKITKRNTSGYKGVSQARDGKKWEARIMKDGKIVWRESFGNPEEAHQAYMDKRNELFGSEWRD